MNCSPCGFALCHDVVVAAQVSVKKSITETSLVIDIIVPLKADWSEACLSPALSFSTEVFCARRAALWNYQQHTLKREQEMLALQDPEMFRGIRDHKFCL